LRRANDAQREHKRYTELRREHGDTVWIRSDGAGDWASYWMFLGRRDAAIDSLAVQLADTTYPFVSRASLAVDPFFAPLRGNPRFDNLLEVK
jgi:hypothetical protein